MIYKAIRVDTGCGLVGLQSNRWQFLDFGPSERERERAEDTARATKPHYRRRAKGLMAADI